ncbi:hypothetical protein D3C73_1527480 [compost metagenome]
MLGKLVPGLLAILRAVDDLKAQTLPIQSQNDGFSYIRLVLGYDYFIHKGNSS